MHRFRFLFWMAEQINVCQEWSYRPCHFDKLKSSIFVIYDVIVTSFNCHSDSHSHSDSEISRKYCIIKVLMVIPSISLPRDKLQLRKRMRKQERTYYFVKWQKATTSVKWPFCPKTIYVQPPWCARFAIYKTFWGYDFYSQQFDVTPWIGSHLSSWLVILSKRTGIIRTKQIQMTSYQEAFETCRTHSTSCKTWNW